MLSLFYLSTMNTSKFMCNFFFSFRLLHTCTAIKLDSGVHLFKWKPPDDRYHDTDAMSECHMTLQNTDTFTPKTESQIIDF